MAPLTTEMILVLFMISLAIFLFIVEWVRVDVVAIIMMVVLPLLGLVTPKEAFIGLSSNAVVSIIAVIIIGAGLDRTGLINRLVTPVMKIAGNSTSRIIIAISLTVAGISSFMQNIGAAALFLPAIQRISKLQNIPLSKLLMPVGFSAILGGTITLVGCSPLILLNDLLAPFHLEPFGLFDVTPIGLALVGSGIATFILLGRWILPQGTETDHDSEGAAPAETAVETEEDGSIYELTTPDDFTHYRDPVIVRDLRERYLCCVLAMAESTGFSTNSPSASMEIHANMNLVVHGKEKDVQRMAEQEQMRLKDQLDIHKSALDPNNAGRVEAVVSPRAAIIGKTLKTVNLRDRFRVSPLSLYRQEQTYRAEIGDIPLQTGDVITLFGTWKRLATLQQEGWLLFNIPTEMESMRPEKGLWAGIWLAVALSMILVFKVQLSVSLMAGALGMVVTRVLSIDEAY